MATEPAPQPPLGMTDVREIRIYSHSMLFYWWPVWVTAFVMAMWTYWENDRLAIVPPDTHVHKDTGGGYRLDTKGPETRLLQEGVARTQIGEPAFRMRISQNSRLGAIFVTVLLLVLVITTVPLRGLWSVVVIVTLILLSVILALANMWDEIFHWLGNLHIHINMAGYFFIGTGLLVMWILAFFFFDRQTYMIFTPGQLKVCLEIGGGETAYDTMGMTVQKHRDDLFRHWILGLGSGDLTVRTSGAQAHTFEMHNVLNIGTKLREIEEMQRERPMVQG
jgi:hypothetical protein